MAKEGGKSGKGRKPGNNGVRGGRVGVGKRGLVEKVEVVGRVIGEGMALIGIRRVVGKYWRVWSRMGIFGRMRR